MSFLSKALNVLLALVATYILVNVNLLLLHIFGPDYLPDFGGGGYEFFSPYKYWWQQYTSTCLIAPLWEELLWRYCVVEITRRLMSKETFRSIQLPFCLLLGINFGLWHGHIYNAFVQGVSGVLLYWVYIKNQFSYWSSFSLHMGWNILCTLGVPFLMV